MTRDHASVTKKFELAPERHGYSTTRANAFEVNVKEAPGQGQESKKHEKTKCTVPRSRTKVNKINEKRVEPQREACQAREGGKAHQPWPIG